MSRIELTDTKIDILMKLAEGIPGACRVLAEIMRDGKKIDPDTEPLLIMLMLDTLEIYGSRIWMLYKDVCGEDITTTIAMLRAVQLGFISRAKFDHAIDHYGDGIDIPELIKQVKEFLPKFGKNEVPAA